MSYFTQRQTKKISLPSNADYWVEILADLRYGEVKRLANMGSDITSSEAADSFLKLAIVSWNLDDESGNVLEINDENIDRLDKKDATALFDELSQLTEDEDTKKNS